MSLDKITPDSIARKHDDSTLLSLIHSLPDVCFVVSPQGIILDANQAFASQFNKIPEEFFGLNVFDFLPLDVGAERMNMLQEAVLTSKSLTFDDEDDGKLIRSTIYPFTSPEGNVDRLLILAQNITDIGQLLKKEQLFNKYIIESIPGIFYFTDANREFVAWNKELRENCFGVSEIEMATTNCLEAFHPEDRDRALETMQDIINNGTEVTNEYRLVFRGNPDIRWYLMTGKRVIIDGSPFLIGVGFDITEHKRTEDTLRLNEKRFKTLFNSQSAIQALLDPDTGKVLDVNQKAVEWYGWSAEELRKMYTRDINTLSQEEIIKSLQTVEAGQHNKFIGRHRRADGSIRDVEIYRNKIELDGKPVIHVITHDITERKHAEAELQRLTRALIVSDHCNKALIHAQDEQELLQTICRIIVETGGYRMAWVGYKVNDEAKSLHPAAYAGSTGDYFNSITLSWADNKYGEGPAGTAVRTAQPVVVNNIITDQSFELWRTEAIKYGYAAFLGLPLVIDDTVAGVLAVYSELPEAFNDAECEQLLSLSNNLAYGIKMLRNREALKQSEERFRNLFERNTAIKMLLDPLTGNIVDANNAAAEFYGWSIEELRQMNIAQIIFLTHPEVNKSNLVTVLKTGHPGFSFRHLMKDGSLRDVKVFSTKINDGRQDLINVIIHDITVQKRYEQLNAFRLHILQIADTHSIEELLIATLDEAEALTGSSIGFVSYVTEDAKTPVLQAVSTNTRQQRQDGEGKSLHYPLEMAGLWAEVEREKKAVIHNDYTSLEHRNRIPDGPVEIKSELVIPVNREGRIVAIFGVGNKQTQYSDNDIAWLEIIANHVWDIVAKKIAEDEIKLQKQKQDKLVAEKEKAEEADRLKSAFLATITHELRTPMNGILGFSELLKDPELSQQKSAEYIDLIHQSGLRLLTLVNELIDIARIEAGECVIQHDDTNINKLLLDLTAFFKIATNKKGLELTCTTTLPDHESIINTDSAKLTQILTNLINNSLKFTFQGGIAIGYSKYNGMLEFTVQDTGIGIPIAMQEKIFDRFIQVDNPLTRTIEGSGLGLSITKAYVTMLGGAIRVESQEGAGSTFTFTLPYNPPFITQRSAFSTVLIVEDDDINRILLKMILKDENMTIHYAHNGQEAVELAKQHPEINLVLMDINMPLLNGYEATRQIKQFRPELPIIVQTAFTSRDEREKAKAAGSDSFITKPIKKSELLALINEQLLNKH